VHSQLDGQFFKNMFICGANNLDLNKTMVNRLNVFPVPDGDTGTNMGLTMSVAVREINNDTSNEITHIADKVASALLRGARGNSGVILSLMFRGISQGLKGVKSADPVTMANAFQKGVEMAYKAVMKPTEGTILTVARVAAQHINSIASECESMDKLFEELIAKADETLQKTPQMLPVLKQANVVDAGGMGLLVIYRGMMHYLQNETMIETDKVEETSEEADFASIATEDIKFTYCTEFLIIKEPLKKADERELKEYLDGMGDSIVVVDDEELIKVHVHTNNPGSVLEKALTMGYLSRIKIENMKEQHTEQIQMIPDASGPRKPYGFVVTCAGDGLKSIFKDMGADYIVDGGQTMNPSTDDIVKAINATHSDVVFVLPNNKNIIMSAQQAVQLVEDKQVVVLQTKTIPQGIGAMLGFDDSMSVEENVATWKQTSPW